MTQPRSPVCLRCFAQVPARRLAYCSDLCQTREAHRVWLASRPGYKNRKGRERWARCTAKINARRRELYRMRKAASA